MSTRRSHVIHPTPNAAPVITRTIEPEILPMLSMVKGFSDAPIVTHTHTPLSSNFKLVGFDGVRRSLQPFVVPEVLKAFSSAVGGASRVGTFELSNPTLHKITRKKA
jgi:hypothetical protein